MQLIYRTATAIYFLGIRIAAIFNSKAAKMISGRKQTRKDLLELPENSEPCIWFHCASLGEFEQGRPLMELFRKHDKNKRIVISFFSPSGYEVRKNYEIANEVYYMPFDTPKNAKYFINKINPDIAIFVKYELWYFHLKYLQAENIDTYLISALFRPKQWFFKLGNSFTQSLFNCFTHIFVQNNESFELLTEKNIPNTSISGDTRVDRVIDIASKSFTDPIIENFASTGNCIIAGSTHQPDEEILLHCLDNQPDKLKMIIAPHFISDKHIKQIEEKANNMAIRYSKANLEILHNYKFLIIDNIGMLSKIYQFGFLAYIGGGFGKGIHNTLEAAVYGIPIIFGPNYQKFEEAIALINEGGAFSIKSNSELNTLLNNLLSNPDYIKEAGKNAKQYISKSKGTVEQIFAKIHTNF